MCHCSTVVELSTHNRKIEGLNPATVTGREREREAKISLVIPIKAFPAFSWWSCDFSSTGHFY
jgi:hypothetical protein